MTRKARPRKSARPKDQARGLVDQAVAIGDLAERWDEIRELESTADDRQVRLAELDDLERSLRRDIGPIDGWDGPLVGAPTGRLPGSMQTYQRLESAIFDEAFRSDPANADAVRILDTAAELLCRIEASQHPAAIDAAAELYELAIRPVLLDEIERERRALLAAGKRDTPARRIVAVVLADCPRLSKPAEIAAHAFGLARDTTPRTIGGRTVTGEGTKPDDAPLHTERGRRMTWTARIRIGNRGEEATGNAIRKTAAEEIRTMQRRDR